MKVWHLGMEIVDLLYKYLEGLPASENYNLKSQMSRSGVSIPSNIAEGSGRTGIKDQLKFFEYSLSSAFELETQSLICEKRKYGDLLILKEILEKLDIEQKMLTGLNNKIRRENELS